MYICMSVCNFFWAAPLSLMILGSGKHAVVLSYISMLGAIEFAMSLLVFMLTFYEDYLTFKILRFLCPILGFVVVTIRTLTGGIEIVETEYGYLYRDVKCFWTFAHYGVLIAAGIAAAVALLYHRGKSSLKRERICLQLWIIFDIVFEIIFVAGCLGTINNPNAHVSPYEGLGGCIGNFVFFLVARYSDMFQVSPTTLDSYVSAHMNTPVVVTDRTGVIIYANRSYREYFNLDKDPVGTKNFINMFKNKRPPEEGMAFVREHNIESHKYPTETLDGRFVEISFTVIRDRFKETKAVLNIIEDVTERQKLLINLEKQKEIAELSRQEAIDANMAKSNFLANMSHEIRTPMNAILGLNEMVMKEDIPPVARGYCQDIYDSGQTLLALINDILDFSKVESGKMEIVPVSYEMSSLLNDVINMSTKKIRDKGLEFETDISPLIPYKLWGDEVRIHQVLINLLNNGAKYTEQGQVKLTVEFIKSGPKRGVLHMAVKDTGIGIHADDLDKIFDKFVRSNMHANRRVEGSGLGLSITKQLVEQMGGKIYVTSSFGKGSEFSVELPQEILDETPMGDFNDALKRARSVRGNKVVPYIAPLARILIIDDNKVNLTVARGLLKGTEIFAEAVLSGSEALEKVKYSKYHIIFVDHMMPDMDGEETLKQMKAMEDNLSLDAKYIALTANAISGSREMYLDMGFDDYLAKPINTDKYLEMIRKYLPPELIAINDGSKLDE